MLIKISEQEQYSVGFRYDQAVKGKPEWCECYIRDAATREICFAEAKVNRFRGNSRQRPDPYHKPHARFYAYKKAFLKIAKGDNEKIKKFLLEFISQVRCVY